MRLWYLLFIIGWLLLAVWLIAGLDASTVCSNNSPC